MLMLAPSYLWCLLQVTSPLERLHEQATESPLQWAPVLAMLIHNHRHHTHTQAGYKLCIPAALRMHMSLLPLYGC